MLQLKNVNLHSINISISMCKIRSKMQMQTFSKKLKVNNLQFEMYFAIQIITCLYMMEHKVHIMYVSTYSIKCSIKSNNIF